MAKWCCVREASHGQPLHFGSRQEGKIMDEILSCNFSGKSTRGKMRRWGERYLQLRLNSLTSVFAHHTYSAPLFYYLFVFFSKVALIKDKHDVVCIGLTSSKHYVPHTIKRMCHKNTNTCSSRRRFRKSALCTMLSYMSQDVLSPVVFPFASNYLAQKKDHRTRYMPTSDIPWRMARFTHKDRSTIKEIKSKAENGKNESPQIFVLAWNISGISD